MKKWTQFGSFSAGVNPWKAAKVTKLPEHLYPRIQVICTCWAVQRCIFFFTLHTSSQFGQWVAEQMDGRCVPFPRLEWLLLHQSAQMPFNVVCRHGEEPRGDMPATPSFPKARVLNTHTRICTHSSAVLQKGFPCVADESTRGWKAEQLSYTMGGWGGQLHSEGCCH